MVNIRVIFGIDDVPAKTKTEKLFAKLMTISLRAFLNSLIETDLPPPPPEGLAKLNKRHSPPKPFYKILFCGLICEPHIYERVTKLIRRSEFTDNRARYHYALPSPPHHIHP